MLALTGVAARVVNAGVMFLTQLLFARALGVAEYGVLTAANTAMLLVAGVATLGLTAMPQRFWPEYAARGETGRLRALLHFATVAPIFIGIVIALAGAGVIFLLRQNLGDGLALAMMLAMLTVPAQASLDVVEGVALARGWKALAYGLGFVVRPLLVPVVFGAAWLFGTTPDAKLAAGALAVATWVAALLLAALVWRKASGELPPAAPQPEIRRWLLAGLPVVMIDGAFMLMTSLDVLLLALLRDEAEVGVYGAAARLVAIVAFVHHGLAWATGHHFSALHQAGDQRGLAEYAARATRMTFLPSVGAAVIVALAAPLLLLLFGRDFSDGGVITAVLLVGLICRSAVGPAEQLLIMTDRQLACAYAYAWAFLVNAAVCLAFVPAHGALAAAAGTALGYGVASIIMAREVKSRLGFDVHVLALMARAPRAAHV
ncbi:MAG: lipopolysaccharide biosynthesis protein [Beijerinckiaceae bacterium]